MNTPNKSKPAATMPPTKKTARPAEGASRYEAYATTQAAADGVEGDAKKRNKTENEKLAAQMTDRR